MTRNGQPNSSVAFMNPRGTVVHVLLLLTFMNAMRHVKPSIPENDNMKQGWQFLMNTEDTRVFAAISTPRQKQFPTETVYPKNLKPL